VRLKYAFIRQHAGDYSIRRLCLTLKVHPSGYYAWLSEPQSVRAKDDQRLPGLIKHSWLESDGVYGYRKIHDDLREAGEDCGHHCVARLMRLEGSALSDRVSTPPWQINNQLSPVEFANRYALSLQGV